MRGTAPVARNAFWLMISLVAWELFQGLRAGAPVPAGSWALAPVDLIFLTLLPALSAFAFARLFLVISQSARGSLNVYTVISSPYAWLFWLGLGIELVGHGVCLASHALRRALPEVFVQGEFAAKVAFLDTHIGYFIFGFGFFLATLVLLLIGQDVGQRVSGLERLVFMGGSLATYGVIFVYLGVESGQFIPALVGGAILSAAGFWALPPSEITRDPIGALVVPGTFMGTAALLIWTLIVGGQPTWP